MVRFSEIQQFPNFLELFPENLRTICPRFENFGNFGRMVSAQCVFIYRTYHIVSQGGLQFYLSEIGCQLVKAPLAAAISPYLISPIHPTHA